MSEDILSPALWPDATEQDFYAALRRLRDAGRIEDAKRVLEALDHKFGCSGSLRYQLEYSKILSDEGNSEGALGYLNGIKSKHPSNHHAFVIQSEILVNTNRYREALDVLRAAPIKNLGPKELENLVFREIQLATFLTPLNEIAFPPATAFPGVDDAVVVMMIRDEEDIIRQNLEHHYRTGFRKFIIALNLCRDSTAPVIANFQNEHVDCSVCTVVDPIEAYYQAGKTKALADFAFTYFRAVRQPVEWCFILDADEFLCAPNGGVAGLVAAANRLARDFISLHLCNATSEDGSEFATGSDPLRHFTILATSAAPVVIKTAFRFSVNPEIAMGNHSLYYPELSFGRNLIAKEVGAYLAHFPYRSRKQIKTKIVNGGRAYQAGDLDESLGRHWRLLYQELVNTGDSLLDRQLTSYRQRTVREATQALPFRFRG